MCIKQFTAPLLFLGKTMKRVVAGQVQGGNVAARTVCEAVLPQAQ
jgi:hypothetical protein